MVWNQEHDTFSFVLLKIALAIWGFLFSSVQFSSVAQSCPTLQPHEPQHTRPPCPSPTPRFTQTHVHWVGDAIWPSHLLSSPSPPTLNLSQHQGLFNESALRVRWSNYWSFSFSISPSNEYLGMISFRMDWLDLLAVQGTLKSLLQHHSSKASICGSTQILGLFVQLPWKMRLEFSVRLHWTVDFCL